MVQVGLQVPASGFTVGDVTSGKDLPVEVQRLVECGLPIPKALVEDPDELVQDLRRMIDLSDFREEGQGDECIYAYGYRCAPDRLKVGRTKDDVVARIIKQITTSTPDKPSLFLTIRTPDSRALEVMMHAALRLRHRVVEGGGDEWFITTRGELLEIYHAVCTV